MLTSWGAPRSSSSSSSSSPHHHKHVCLPPPLQDAKEAHFYLALAHEYGKGVAKDFARALKGYRRASQLGHVAATYNLGLMVAYGRGTHQVRKDARKEKKKSSLKQAPAEGVAHRYTGSQGTGSRAHIGSVVARWSPRAHISERGDSARVPAVSPATALPPFPSPLSLWLGSSKGLPRGVLAVPGGREPPPRPRHVHVRRLRAVRPRPACGLQRRAPLVRAGGHNKARPK